MTKENLTPLQMVILEKIVKNSITAISYYHPKEQIGKLTKSYDEILRALESLSRDFQIIRLDPVLKLKRKFWFKTSCGYRVDLEKAKELYDSLKPENSEPKKEKKEGGS
ncbi:hypothetical protein KKD91_04040 [Patescibacteria group bacterium]|nr:hypothetical protein [Patescibacteria group bacterium]